MHLCKGFQPTLAATAGTMVKLCFFTLQVFTDSCSLPLNSSVWFDGSLKCMVVSSAGNHCARNCFCLHADQVVALPFLLPSIEGFKGRII